MAQFTVYRNKNPKSKAYIPFLLDVQSDLLGDLSTRVVVPLFSKTHSPKPFTRLTPELELEDQTLVLMTPQLAGISLKDLGEPAGSLAQHRTDIIAALDLLFTGI